MAHKKYLVTRTPEARLTGLVFACGRFAYETFERLVVDGIVRGTSGGVSGLGTAVKTAQSGFVRFYALLVIGGLAGLGLYFLLAAS